MSIITGLEIQKMTEHFLKTPVFGYLGSAYGQDNKSMLQQPQSSSAPDEFLRKLRTDVLVLDVLPSNAVNLYGVKSGVDRLGIVLEVAGKEYQVS